MRVLDPGHLYELATLDKVDGWAETFDELRFVKRIGDKFPGNAPPGYRGTTTQEVIRALIDRTIYVNDQEQHPENDQVIFALRQALYMLECRAAKVRGDQDEFRKIARFPTIERQPTCDTCGHVACTRHGNG